VSVGLFLRYFGTYGDGDWSVAVVIECCVGMEASFVKVLGKNSVNPSSSFC
jgi:hypothetical protein